MSYRYIIALDPSGNFHEGKGTTGWCLYDTKLKIIKEAGSISAKEARSKEAYWDEVLRLVQHYVRKYKEKVVLVVEDYLLYANRATNQINSRMETSKLIGILQYWCWTCGVKYAMQLASDVKNRWTNEILVHKGILAYKGKSFIIKDTGMRIDRHCIDSVRHAIHFATFKNK